MKAGKVHRVTWILQILVIIHNFAYSIILHTLFVYFTNHKKILYICDNFQNLCTLMKIYKSVLKLSVLAVRIFSKKAYCYAGIDFLEIYLKYTISTLKIIFMHDRGQKKGTMEALHPLNFKIIVNYTYYINYVDIYIYIYNRIMSKFFVHLKFIHTMINNSIFVSHTFKETFFAPFPKNLATNVI